MRILTNSLSSNDVGIVHAGYATYRKALLRGGDELYELNKKLSRQQRKEKKGAGGSSKASLHAKSFVFDRRQVFIGSLNLDPRSLLQDTEIGVVIGFGLQKVVSNLISGVILLLEKSIKPGDVIEGGTGRQRRRSRLGETWTGMPVEEFRRQRCRFRIAYVGQRSGQRDLQCQQCGSRCHMGCVLGT